MNVHKKEPKKRLLIVATVSLSLKSFFIPYAEYFRKQGWVVDGAANGVVDDSSELSEFDNLFEIPWQRRIFSLGNLGGIRKVRAVVLSKNYALIHVHTPISAMLLRVALMSIPSRARPKVVYTAHGFHFHQGRNKLHNVVFRSIEKCAIRYTDALVVMNEEDYQAARNLIEGEKCRLYKIPGVGLDLGRYRGTKKDTELRRKLSIGGSEKILVVIGELNASKRPQDVIKAVSYLTRDTTTKLLIIGDGPLFKELVELVKDLELEEKVTFLGYRKDIPAILGIADLLLLASVREGLPRVIMEAMAAKVPMVATNIRGNRDLLKDGAGMLVPVYDPKSLSKAIENTFEHVDETAKRVNVAYQRIQTYDIKNVLAIHKQIYDELVT